MTTNLLTINPTPLQRGFLLAWSAFHQSHIRLETGLMTRPECGLSDQTGLILWWPVDGVLDGVLEIMLPLDSYLGHLTRSIAGLIRDQRSSLAGCWATPSERHRVTLAYLCLRQVRKHAEQAKTPVRKRKSFPSKTVGPFHKPPGPPAWPVLGRCGPVLQLDSHHARRVTPWA
jgi:hypothetical protein